MQKINFLRSQRNIKTISLFLLWSINHDIHGIRLRTEEFLPYLGLLTYIGGTLFNSRSTGKTGPFSVFIALIINTNGSVFP